MTARMPRPKVSGAQLFARYAYAPNALGFCGPADHLSLFEYGSTGVTDAGLVELAKAFEGAWPYLELIARGTGIRDPLDRRVVESYWIGTPLLAKISVTEIGNSMEDRFRSRSSSEFSHLVEGVLAGGVPHHSFHVFEVYPWVGLLHDERKAATALHVLDRCRVRWGTVLSTAGDQAEVSCGLLQWNGNSLVIGAPTTETVTCAIGNAGFVDQLVAGDVVSLHWDWVCDKLTAPQLRQLQYYTALHLHIANAGLEHRGTALATV